MLDQGELSMLVRARDEAARALASVPRIPDDLVRGMIFAAEQMQRARPVLEQLARASAMSEELVANYRAIAPVTLGYPPPRTPAYLTTGVTEPVYVPEDDPAALRERLAERDEQIAELQAEVRAVRFALAFDSVEYPDDVEPEDFSSN